MAGLLGRQFPTVEAMLRDAGDDRLALADFPVAHWKAAGSTNRLEPLEQEIKRRTDVVGVCPSPEALLRRAEAVLVEAPDEGSSPTAATSPQVRGAVGTDDGVAPHR